MKLKTLYLTVGQSQYDIFGHWHEQLRAGFAKQGVTAQILRDPRAVAVCDSGDGTVSIGFNLVGCRLGGGPERRHIAWSVDHPVFNEPFFRKRRENPQFGRSIELLFVDRSRCFFAEECLAAPPTHFLPHAASAPFAEISDWAARPYDLVFFGTMEFPDKYKKQLLEGAATVSPAMVRLLEQVLAEYSYEAGRPLDLEFWNLLDTSFHLSREDLQKLFLGLFPLFELYCRYQHRIRFFRSIRSHRVHVFGNGPWDQIGLTPNITVHPAISHLEIPEVLRQSKLVVNHAPVHREGSHERVFDALASGCGVLSTPSTYLSEEFGPQQGLAFCPSGQEPQLDEQLAGWLGSDRRVEIRMGQQRVRTGHTMDVRAKQLLHLIKQRWDLSAERREPVCAE